MRLTDAGLHQRQTKALYPKHRLPPWLNEAAVPRSLEPIVGRHRAVRQINGASNPRLAADIRARHFRRLRARIAVTIAQGPVDLRVHQQAILVFV